MQPGCRAVMFTTRIFLLAGTILALGCSQDEGPKRFHLTGTVTFDGKPIPQGMIVFTPDLSKNNDGPQGVANIKDGRYDTQAAGGQDITGGPMAVSVTGLSADSRPLCQYDFSIELPLEKSTKDIAVPASAASKSNQFEAP